MRARGSWTATRRTAFGLGLFALALTVNLLDDAANRDPRNPIAVLATIGTVVALVAVGPARQAVAGAAICGVGVVGAILFLTHPDPGIGPGPEPTITRLSSDIAG